ncbi:MAG: oligosaccharide flippase family protein [Desulfovibrio sp.]|nr:oligosaccharide flippase family protein [Desulfovibrio sp.]
MKRLKSIPRRLGFILGAQWTRDLSWTLFIILLSRRSPDILGEIVLALTFGYLVKTATDIGLNDFLLSTFARREGHPRALLSEVSWLKLCALAIALLVAWAVCEWQNYGQELKIIVFCVAGGLGLDALSDSFFALCQARGRQDVEMRVRIPSALLGIGYGVVAVLAGWSPIAIALYKPIESVFCAAFVVYALGDNPFGRVNPEALRDLWQNLKKGAVFTGMAVCAMFYNKINVIFLKKYGGNVDVGGYGVAWETIEGLSVLVSSALLGKVIFPLLARLWRENKEAFRKLAGQTARSLWAAALPMIFLIWVESDRFLTLIYGPDYAYAVKAQQWLTPCLATAFLHNLAAYAMIGMREQNLLFGFYLSGLVVNLVCCFTLIPVDPLGGAALTLTLTKVWVAILTVGYFQSRAKPMTAAQWLILAGTGFLAVFLWRATVPYIPRELAEFLGLLPLLALFWSWRPPSLFEKKKPDDPEKSSAAGA